MTQIADKETLRVHYRKIRDQLSDSRRKEASSLLFAQLRNTKARKILSFVSLRSEIDITALNQQFALEGRLVLPRCNEGELDLYAVQDISTQLSPGAYGIQEPIPSRCRKIPLSEIDLVLVPGIAFDADHYRLGYGKGFYDALLKGSSVHSIGVGFREQITPKLLPKDSWDISLTELLLF